MMATIHVPDSRNVSTNDGVRMAAAGHAPSASCDARSLSRSSPLPSFQAQACFDAADDNKARGIYD